MYALFLAMLAANVYVLLYAIIALMAQEDLSRKHLGAMTLGAVGMGGAVLISYWCWPFLFD